MTPFDITDDTHDYSWADTTSNTKFTKMTSDNSNNIIKELNKKNYSFGDIIEFTESEYKLLDMKDINNDELNTKIRIEKLIFYFLNYL